MEIVKSKRIYNKISQIILICLAFMKFFEFYDDKMENNVDTNVDFSVLTENVEKVCDESKNEN